MDSSETSSNSQLHSDFPDPLPGMRSLSDSESPRSADRPERNVSSASDGAAADRSLASLRQAIANQPKHRIAAVRESQSVTLRTISRRSGVPVRVLRQQERPHSDLQISDLLIWAAALEVPVSELLAEPEDSLCGNIAQRAKMVRLMKTVEAMRAHAHAGAMRHLADGLRQQLLDIMPELADVTAWPKEGSRRPGGNIGRIATHPISTDRVEPPSGNDPTS